MPHISIKLLPGRPEALKAKLAEAMARTVIDVLGCGEDAVSVAVEEVAQGDWMDQVYAPDILGKTDSLYRKPGYGPLR